MRKIVLKVTINIADNEIYYMKQPVEEIIFDVETEIDLDVFGAFADSVQVELVSDEGKLQTD